VADKDSRQHAAEIQARRKAGFWRWSPLGTFSAVIGFLALVAGVSVELRAEVAHRSIKVIVVGGLLLVFGAYTASCLIAYVFRLLREAWLRFRCASMLADDFLRATESYDAIRAENDALRQSVAELRLFASIGRTVLAAFWQEKGLPPPQGTPPPSLPDRGPTLPLPEPTNPQEPRP